MIFKCPHCTKSLDAADDLAGLETQCPRCHQKIQIPELPAAVSDAPVKIEAADATSSTPPASADPSQPVSPPPIPPAPPLPPKISGLAVASMVLGIVGIVPGLFCGGFILSILAIIFGHIAYARISRNPQALAGKGMAIAGLVTGYVGLVLLIVAIVAFGALSATIRDEVGKAIQCLPVR